MPDGRYPGTFNATRALPASHGQNDGSGYDLQNAIGFVQGDDFPRSIDIEHHRIEFVLDAQGMDLIHIPCRILGSGQFLFERMQAKTVMDALIQDPTEIVFPFKDQDVSFTILIGANRRR
jgi:hypothetical protein